MKYIVVGLGNYGGALASRLTDLGHEVIGVDSNSSRVDSYKDRISGAICLNASDSNALKILPLKDAHSTIVAIGENFAASVQATAILKQLGVKHLVARGINKVHIGVLEAIGVDKVIFPEQDAAELLAQTLSISEFRSSYRIDNDHYIFQVTVPTILVGRTIENSRIQEFGLMVITIKERMLTQNLLGINHTTEIATGTPSPQSQFKADDVIVAYGRLKDFDNFINSIK
ncbi:MAG: TrkA family potassium uptake protein [Mucinivorans sp.]